MRQATDAFGASFRRAAAARSGSVEAMLAFAGRPVRVRVAGRALADQVMRAFSHLRAENGTPELDIELWDEAETGVRCAEAAGADQRGSVSCPAPDLVVHRQAGAITELDRRASRILGWRADAARTGIHDLAKPLAVALTVWYLDRAVGVVHAGLVARGGDGILIAGPAGAGKSTCALACAAAGFDFLGDDQVALEASGNGFVAHSMFATARLGAEQRARHPTLACGATIATSPGEKDLLLLGDAPGASLVPAARVRAIVLPRAEPGSSGLAPVPAARALLALAPTSLLGVLGGGAEGLERLARLTARVPAFELVAGPHIDEIPDLVDGALERAGR